MEILLDILAMQFRQVRLILNNHNIKCSGRGHALALSNGEWIGNKHREYRALRSVIRYLNAAARLVDIACHQKQANTVLCAHNVVLAFRLTAESLAKEMRFHRLIHPQPRSATSISNSWLRSEM